VWRGRNESRVMSEAEGSGVIPAPDHGIVLRPATPADDSGIVQLLCQTLGWKDDDRHRSLFDWKHRRNPFGPSPGWVAEDEQGLVGSRTFMRWEFLHGEQRLAVVRAVDTATHPRAQGRGVFRALTLKGIEDLTRSGVLWVFNTPNDRSAPGYLSMGWRRLGRLPVAVRPAGLIVGPRLLSARQPGSLWSIPTSAGEDAAAVFDDRDGWEELLSNRGRNGLLHTDRSVTYLQWRYGDTPVGCRALLGGSTVRDGVVFFRLRRRGRAVEAVISDLLTPADSTQKGREMCRSVLFASGADYLIALGRSRPRRWIPVPGNGPLLTWRGLAQQELPALDQWDLSAGDIELF
jgi:hypothetical protein